LCPAHITSPPPFTAFSILLFIFQIKQLSLELGSSTRTLDPADLFPGGVPAAHPLSRHTLESVRLRMCVLIAINDMVWALLPAIDLRGPTPLPMSLADLYCRARHLLMHDLTIPWFNKVLNATAERHDAAATV
jgi:hypothetical protein